MAIAAESRLPVLGQQGGERMQKLFLGGRLVGQKMEIVQEKDIAIAEMLAKRAQLAQAHGLDEAVGEILGGNVTQPPLRPGFFEAGKDPFEKMSFAAADRTIQEQGNGPLAGLLNQAQGGGVGHPITRADDKVSQLMPAAAVTARPALGFLAPGFLPT